MEASAMSWDGILAISTVFLAIFTLLLAVGVPVSIRYASREEIRSSYSALDNAYLEIQRLIIEYPHLAQPTLAGKTEDQVAQYNAFAFLTWNFIETIHDVSQDDEFLRETWHCILIYESGLHQEWFKDKDNRKRFKKRFVDAMRAHVDLSPDSI